MEITKVDFDIKKWATHKQRIINPYIQEIIISNLKRIGVNPENAVYRGGYGRKEDFERLLQTGSDYPIEQNTFYASPLEKVGREPWVRGSFDPLYWALKGHQCEEEHGFNPITAITAYRGEKIQ